MILYEPEGIPLARVYARTIHDAVPSVLAVSNENEFRVSWHHGSFRVYLMDPTHIHSVMSGRQWEDPSLDPIFSCIRHLPYAEDVIAAVLLQAAFLDRNPGYRGVPVRASGKDPARKVAPAQLEVGGQESGTRTRRRKSPHDAQMGMFGEMQDEP